MDNLILLYIVVSGASLLLIILIASIFVSSCKGDYSLGEEGTFELGDDAARQQQQQTLFEKDVQLRLYRKYTDVCQLTRKALQNGSADDPSSHSAPAPAPAETATVATAVQQQLPLDSIAVELDIKERLLKQQHQQQDAAALSGDRPPSALSTGGLSRDVAFAIAKDRILKSSVLFTQGAVTDADGERCHSPQPNGQLPLVGDSDLKIIASKRTPV